MIRINKYLSMCGVTSRRGAEALINEKRITVNDQVVEKLSTFIDEKNDVVKVDGKIVSLVEVKIYVIMNKPANVMTTLDDPFGRKTIVNYLNDLPTRVYPVGRLDYDTEGLLLLTNDGDLAFRLAHPSFQIPKVYEAVVEGSFTDKDAGQIEGGITLEDGAVGKGKVEILKQTVESSKIRITLKEGRKREVKQLCRATGHPVKKLRRIKFAGLTLKGLQYGQWRMLSSDEIEHLKTSIDLK